MPPRPVRRGRGEHGELVPNRSRHLPTGPATALQRGPLPRRHQASRGSEATGPPQPRSAQGLRGCRGGEGSPSELHAAGEPVVARPSLGHAEKKAHAGVTVRSGKEASRSQEPETPSGKRAWGRREGKHHLYHRPRATCGYMPLTAPRSPSRERQTGRLRPGKWPRPAVFLPPLLEAAVTGLSPKCSRTE